MKKISIILLTVIVIGGMVGGFFFYRNWKNEEDNWEEEEEEIVEESICNDVSQKYWASSYISYVIQKEMMQVDDNNNFFPEKTLSWKEFIITIMKAVMPRKDASAMTNQELLTFLKEYKVIEEKMDEEKLETEVTKLDVATTLAKVDIHILGNHQRIKEINFVDVGKIDDVGKALIEHSVESGFIPIKSETAFYPNQYLTRAEIAEIWYLFLNR